MCGSLFWGSILVVIGITMLFNAIFGINLPIIKVLIAIFLIYTGFKMLMPSSFKKWEYKIFECSSQGYKVEKDLYQESYKVCFTSSTIDLSYLNNISKPKTVHIISQFANVNVMLPNNIPLRVKANSTFAAIHLPGKEMNSEYTNLHGSLEPLLTVFIDGTFSSIVVSE